MTFMLRHELQWLHLKWLHYLLKTRNVYLSFCNVITLSTSSQYHNDTQTSLKLTNLKLFPLEIAHEDFRPTHDMFCLIDRKFQDCERIAASFFMYQLCILMKVHKDLNVSLDWLLSLIGCFINFKLWKPYHEFDKTSLFSH